MAKTFTTIQTDVGNNVQDTSNDMKSLISVYINDRYRDILRRVNWDTIDEDYTFTTVGGTQDYTMESDFKKEVYVYDTTNNIQLKRITLQDYADNYVEEASGNPTKYVMLDVIVGGVRTKKMRLVPTPLTALTISVPYTLEPIDLTGTAVPIIACDQALTNGATASAFRYKRQFSKAADYEAMYERDIQTLVWDQVNQPNQVHTFTPAVFNRNNLI